MSASSVYTVTFLCLMGFQLQAQSKADKKCVERLKADIGYLASDELEGRRTGTEGEKKAAAFIEKRYQALGIQPYNGSYIHPFQFQYGKEIAAATTITINNNTLSLPAAAFPFSFSASRAVSGEVMPDILEQDGIWLQPLYATKDDAENPHFDAEKQAFEQARAAIKNGATAVVIFDGYGSQYAPEFNKHSDLETLSVPVIFLTHKAYKQHIADVVATGKSSVSFSINVAIAKAERTGTNLAAYINNGATHTVVLGAHFDHLGYGEDHNSLHANAAKEHLVHNGADDNASGTAALLELAKRIKATRKLKKYNYLFVNFSGEELGLYGSKAFVKSKGLDSNTIAYMINMDMVGRLNDSTHALTIGGVGTSPSWASVVAMAGNYYKVAIDSAGVGPSDHTSFYNAGIPVLFFFTGTHRDYHKPSDDAHLINYEGEATIINYITNVVKAMDKQDKPQYRVTKQTTAGKTRFKVSLGIMPDYTFNEGGVKVDGVTEGRPAAKAGVKTGDIITQLGDNKINGMQTYMEALGKFEPGAKTQIKLLRQGQELTLPVDLAK